MLLPFKSNQTYKARSQIIADIFADARTQSHVFVANRPQASHPRNAAGIVSKGQVDEQVKEFVPKSPIKCSECIVYQASEARKK